MERTTPITLYLGCFDDKVAQFPWVKRLSNRDLLTSIAHQILLGRQSFVTDAHLFLNPQIYRDVLHDDNSALRYLVNAGQIRIPRRTKTFRALIEEQQQAEILSFKAMSPETIEDIERLDEQMSGFGRNLMGPPSQQIWRGFDLLAQEFSQKPFASLGLDRSEVSEDSWKRFVDVFQSVNPHERRSRKQWEAAIDATEPYHDADLSDISTRKRRLMNIGNEIYHINHPRCAGAR